MKIATYNVNGVIGRLDILLRWLGGGVTRRRLPPGIESSAGKVSEQGDRVGRIRCRLPGSEILERRRDPCKGAARGYIEALCGIPSLITLLFVFFALPRIGIETSPIAASILGLGLWNAANIGEAARGALSSIASGQTVASRALGMNQMQTIVWVIFPQAFRRFLPPYVSQLTILIQASTLTSVVGVTDLLGSARQMIERLAYVSDSSHAILIYACVMGCFFVVCYPLTLLAQLLEGKIRLD